jgi:hypothetical protein
MRAPLCCARAGGRKEDDLFCSFPAVETAGYYQSSPGGDCALRFAARGPSPRRAKRASHPSLPNAGKPGALVSGAPACGARKRAGESRNRWEVSRSPASENQPKMLFTQGVSFFRKQNRAGPLRDWGCLGTLIKRRKEVAAAAWPRGAGRSKKG